MVNFCITFLSIVLKGKVIKKVNHYDYDVSKILNMFCSLNPILMHFLWKINQTKNKGSQWSKVKNIIGKSGNHHHTSTCEIVGMHYSKRDLKLLGKFNSWLKLNLNKKICNGLSKEHDIRIEETFFSFIVRKYSVQYCPINQGHLNSM